MFGVAAFTLRRRRRLDAELLGDCPHGNGIPFSTVDRVLARVGGKRVTAQLHAADADRSQVNPYRTQVGGWAAEGQLVLAARDPEVDVPTGVDGHGLVL